MERYLRVNLLGPGPRLMKKEFTRSRSHKGWERLVYNILYMRSFKCLPVHVGLNGYGKEIIILLVYRCIFCFVGLLLRKTPLSVRAHESARGLAVFCQILYCGGVPNLSGTFQHWLKSIKNDTMLRLTCLCAHLERKFLHSCQSNECHKKS